MGFVLIASSVLFLAGPPFGPAIFDKVIARLGVGSARSVLDPAAPGGWKEGAARLESELGRGTSSTVLVAHGLAVPAAIALALRSPPRALVISNGPIRTVDPVSAALARVCASASGRALATRTALRPGVWLRWLASSAGLRRAVVNPYVMDRDTVAVLCGPLVESAGGRAALAGWVGSLTHLPDARALRCPTLLLWGDGDPLYPASEASFAEANVPGARYVAIDGGQHVHPEERPWEMADRLREWLRDQGVGGIPATPMS